MTAAQARVRACLPHQGGGAAALRGLLQRRALAALPLRRLAHARHAHTPHRSGPQDPSRTLLGPRTCRPDIKTDLRSGFHAQWEAYQAVNGHFAAAVARVARPNDLVWVHWLHTDAGASLHSCGREQVWVHDYHLMLLPGLLRARQPRLRIGWFLHTPFPSLEALRTTRDEIVTSSLHPPLP